MRDKTVVIFGNNLRKRKTRLYEIISLLTNIDHDGYKSKKHDGNEEGNEEVFKYVPINFFHACGIAVKIEGTMER